MNNLFDQFQQYHQNQNNRYCHYLGLTLIILSSLGLIHGLHITYLSVNLATWLYIFGLAIDYLFFPGFIIANSIFIGLLLLLGAQLSVLANLILFTIGWFFQILGHAYFEKNSPAFLDNLLHNFTGPRWVINQLATFVLSRPLTKKDGHDFNPDFNDAIRQLLGLLIPTFTMLTQQILKKRILHYERNQAKLKQKYNITSQKSSEYTSQTRQNIEQLAKQTHRPRFIYTSGTTSEPKKILYTPSRLLKYKKMGARCAVQVFKKMHIARPSIFILVTINQDDSFTSMVTAKKTKDLGYFNGLIDASQYLFHPAIKPLIDRFGLNAVRLWLMVLANPEMIYSTNPSTLTVFIQDIQQNWTQTVALIKLFDENKTNHNEQYFTKETLKIVQHIVSDGYEQRIKEIAASSCALPISTLITKLKCYCCWDGGYVTPFVKQLKSLLPSNIKHVPMYSMSTETIETELYLHDDQFYFLPFAHDVYYEFNPVLADGSLDCSQYLGAKALKIGHEYHMIVSDCYGLTRYETKDIFVVKAKINELPSLEFVRRYGINYSFTGEKITGEQLIDVYESLCDHFSILNDINPQFALFPSISSEGALPGYKLIIVHALNNPPQKQEEIAQYFEMQLSTINSEFAAKRSSERLQKTQVLYLHYDQLATLMINTKPEKRSPAHHKPWESQFKLLPLYSQLWEKVIAHS